jgi:hypothetical protein
VQMDVLWMCHYETNLNTDTEGGGDGARLSDVKRRPRCTEEYRCGEDIGRPTGVPDDDVIMSCVVFELTYSAKLKKKNSVALSPRANYVY